MGKNNGRFIKMRIGISGAQGTGKTTLLNHLRLEDAFMDYDICDEVTRRVKSYGLPINENGNDITQRLIMQEHIVNVFMHPNMITDRTALDGFVYTQYLFKSGKVSAETLKYAQKVFERLIFKYDLLFYIEPQFNLEDDGVRSPSIMFRDRIVSYFDEVIIHYELPIIRLTGSVKERVNQVITTMKDIKDDN